MVVARPWSALPALFMLAGCGTWFGAPEAPPLPGERVPVLNLVRGIEADSRIADVEVRLPRPATNAAWPQPGGVPSHAMHHLAASGGLEPLWRADIGAGSSDDEQLLAQPVISGGRVYTMDVNASVRAFEAETGRLVWTAELEPDEDDEGILGGGIAVDGAKLYVTTGYAEVVALDAGTGKEVWRRRLTGPMRAGPTVRAGRVFAVTIANELFALAADDGRKLWSHSGITETAGLLGGAAPAVEAGIVVVPYSSGEVFALRIENGRVVWSDSLAPLRRTDPVSALAHIVGRPVIDRDRVFVVGHSGRMAAIDLRTGGRAWEQPVGGVNGPWVAGDFVYVMTGQAELVCLSRRDGRVRWVRPLQQFEDEDDREDPIRWAGPVLAGDRLIVAGSNGEVWSVSPYTGKLLGRIELGDGIAMAPSVANQTLFVLTDGAQLIALR